MEADAEKEEPVNSLKHLHALSNGFDLFNVFEEEETKALMLCAVAILMIHFTFQVKERLRLSFLVY